MVNLILISFISSKKMYLFSGIISVGLLTLTMYVFEPYTKWKMETVSVFGEDVPVYISSKKNTVIRFKMPTLMEGLDYYNGKLYVIFESGAQTYADAKEINKDIWEMDIDNIID